MRNTRPAPQTVDKLIWTFNGNDTDLIGDLGSTLLDPGEKVDVTATVEVDICEENIFTTTTEVIMYEP